eukprot:COSAG06_NODE_24795_length_652_cov_1.110307_1_plen_21_part_10
MTMVTIVLFVLAVSRAASADA